MRLYTLLALILIVALAAILAGSALAQDEVTPPIDPGVIVLELVCSPTGTLLVKEMPDKTRLVICTEDGNGP
jgi:hypothetical protein